MKMTLTSRVITCHNKSVLTIMIMIRVNTDSNMVAVITRIIAKLIRFL